MKEEYEKPEIITEDISVAFAGQCCPENYNEYPPTLWDSEFCNCPLIRSNRYAQ